MFSLELPHLGDSNEYTQYTIFNIITLYFPKSAAMGFFPRTREQVQNSHGKWAISVEPLKFYCITNEYTK